jgi:type II secretory pathway component HofQ
MTEIDQAIWRQGVSDRPGVCIQCGKPIAVGESVGFSKSITGPWIRAHEACIPARERSQTALPRQIEPKAVPKSLEVSEAVELAILSIAESLNRMAKSIALIEERGRR